ncbi:hypothetical protein CRG98_032180 [Punica granatum]|uniref:Uncharacterized protein n=1 Tax=Punica granatum TaxID=22663 RepID=A0A2I0ITW2_PUNGR|nr:hypothetical protein CRG98_032180 [Punica granatum]
MEKKTMDMDGNGMDEAAIGVAVGPTSREVLGRFLSYMENGLRPMWIKTHMDGIKFKSHDLLETTHYIKELGHQNYVPEVDACSLVAKEIRGDVCSFLLQKKQGWRCMCVV